MLHPATELRYVNQTVGNGIFATAHIPVGTVIWVRDPLDREFTPEEFDALNPLLRDSLLTYSYRNRKGHFIFCWDNTKYINHSFNANCMTTPYGFEIAVRHIAPGEELTNDYGTLNIIEPFEPVDEGSERRVVFPDDLANFYGTWDPLINIAVAKLLDVDQPLWSLLDETVRTEMPKIIGGEMPYLSVLNCLYTQRNAEVLF